ncbi:MAG: class III extradiol ring-cleavage dioxygenase, partial [Novosphingobium sp.]
AWTGMADFLRNVASGLPRRPDAIIVISGHWETKGFVFTAAAQPELIYDYHGFPPHTYQITYPVPGAPQLASNAGELLQQAGLAAQTDPARGLDHGVFIPLKVMFPEADVPIIEMSLDAGLDPALHLAAGRALAPLRERNVLLVGSGMSFHNMRGYRDPQYTEPSRRFDAWLTAAMETPLPQRSELLASWTDAPGARLCHPREEHLLPAMVVAGASQAVGRRVYADTVLDTAISGFAFP